MNTLDKNIIHNIYYNFLTIDDRIVSKCFNRFSKNKLLNFEKLLFPENIGIPDAPNNSIINKMIGIWYTIKVPNSETIYLETIKKKYMVVYDYSEYNYREIIYVSEFPVTHIGPIYKIGKRELHFSGTWNRIKEIVKIANITDW